MALLGKTLKGRSTKAATEMIRNIRIRQQSKLQGGSDQEKKLLRDRRDALKNTLAEEGKIVNYNRKKLLTNWRNIMRIAKTEELKNEIEIYSQNNQRELDSKEAFLQMLDKNLDEAEDQYQIALRNHLIHIDQLLALQDNRLAAMNNEFERDARIIEEEFDREREEIEALHKRQKRELEDMFATVKEDEKNKAKMAMESHQGFREQTKNQNLEELNHMKMILDARQRKLNNDLDALHQKYVNDTYSKTKEHGDMFKENKKKTLKIDNLSKSIERLNEKLKHMKLKITQHNIECSKRNQLLKKEKENISRNYQELKGKMTKFREDEQKRLTELAMNSRNAVLKLKECVALGERILKTAELCRRLETEKEKVIPFYEGTVEETDIPEDLKRAFEEITPEQYDEYSYLDNFYKRYNKVHLDKVAIHKQKEQLDKDNGLFKSMLKQYLDGISLNDDVLKSINPLLVINNKINVKLPVERMDGARTIIEGNKVVGHYRLQNS